MRFICFSLVAFILIGCSSSISQKEIFAHRVSANYSQKLRNQEQMILQGKGGSRMNKITLLFYDYACPKLVELDEARSITMRCIEVFLNTINNDTDIRPFLANYPCSPISLELIITFYPFEPTNPFAKQSFICTVFFAEGILFYRKFDVDQQKRVTILTEAYEEALQKVSSGK